MNGTLFYIVVALLTVFRTLFGFDTNIAYDKLPIDFTVESVSDVYVPSDENANVSEYPTIIKLRHQKNEAENGKLFAHARQGSISLKCEF